MSESIHGYDNFEKYAKDITNNFLAEQPTNSSVTGKSLLKALLININNLKDSLLASKTTSNVEATIKDIIQKKDSVRIAYDAVNKQNIQMPLLLQTLKNIENQITVTQSHYKKKTNTIKPAPKKNTTVLKTSATSKVTKSAKSTPEIALTPEQWGIKFTADKPYFMDLLPARQSTIPVQGGRDVPNAMPGLNYKLVTQVGKQAIPGFSPVYQNLGIKGMQVTIVGAFTGGDGANQLADIKDDPEDKFKTSNPFWSNAKGSPSLSDNPGRGGKLPELNAYNSYTEFVQVCQQGKQMKVEINLFQVYRESKATQIGEAVKLQSKNGNPEFTGIVRSLDVYHATKERTWYTLIMDVTDFGMASKGAINLNNKLEEAIKNAQAELDKVKAAEATQAAKTNAAVVPQAESGNDTRTIDELTKTSTIIDNINAITDPNQKTLQIECYGHMLKVLQHIQNSDIYVFKNYLTQIFNGNKNFGDFLGKLYNTGKYSDIKFSYKTEQIQVVSARVECVVIPLTTTTAFCSYHVYWKIDFGNKEQPITRYTEVDNLGSALQNLRPNGQTMGFLGLQGTAIDKCEGTKAEKNDLLKGLVGWNGKALQNVAGRLVGCVLGQGAALGTISAATGGLGTIPMAALLASNCGLQSLAEAYQTMFEFNNEEGKFGEELAGSLLTNFLLTLGTAGLGGAGSKIRGNGFRQGLLTGVGGTLKQGGTVAGASSTVTQTVNKFVDDIANILTNNIDNLPGKTITSGNIEYVIEKAVKDSNGKVTSVYVKDANGIFSQIPVEKIEGIDISLGGSQPKVTSTPDPSITTLPDSTNPPTTTSSSTVSRLDKAIDDILNRLAPNIKQAIKSKTNKQTILGLMKRWENIVANPFAGKKIKVDLNGESIIIDELDILTFSETGVKINNRVITYESIKNVSTLPKVTATKPSVKPQPKVSASALDNLISSLDDDLFINAQAKANLIANADDNFKDTVYELLTAKQNGTLNQYELYYAGNGTTRPITDVRVTETNFYLFYSRTGGDGFSFTQDLSGRIRKVQAKPTSSKPSIPQQQTTTQTTQTQQPSTGGSSQSSKQYATVLPNTTIELLRENVDNLPNFFTRSSDISYTMGMERNTLKLINVQYNSNNNTISFIKRVKTNTGKTLNIFNEIDSNVRSNVYTYGMNKVYKSNASDISDLSGLSNQAPTLLTASGKVTTLVTNNNIRTILPSNGNSIKALYRLNQNTNSLILSRFINPLDKLGDVEILTVTNIGNGKYRISTTASIQRDNLTTQIVSESDFLELFQSLSIFE